jgi:hypothetical protein
MIPGDHAKGRDQTRSPKFSVSNLNSLSFEQLSDNMDQMDDSRSRLELVKHVRPTRWTRTSFKVSRRYPCPSTGVEVPLPWVIVGG